MADQNAGGGWTDGTTLKDKLKKGFLYKAAKDKSDAKAAAKQAKLDEIEKKQEWKVAKAEYKAKEAEAITEITDIFKDKWDSWNKEKRKLVNENKTEEEIEETHKSRKEEEDKAVTNILTKYQRDIEDYIKKAEKYKPKLGEKLTVEVIQQHIRTKAEDKFNEYVEMMMKLAQQMAKMRMLQQQQQFQLDEVNRKIGELPLKVEETIDEIKDTLDLLLGKSLSPFMNPDKPEFDIDVIIAQIKAALNPVIMTTTPLQSVVGKIPVIGEMAGILTMMSNDKPATDLTDKELSEMVPNLPSLDPTLLEKLSKIMDDIWAFLITLPTLLTTVAFSMLDVIWSKLKTITSVIPLGGMFPLNLVPVAIDACPKIVNLIKLLPGMLGDALRGMIQKKLRESMAMSLPKIDTASLSALADEIQEQPDKKKRETETKKDYTDVTVDVYTSTLSAYGYSLTDLKKIQKHYKKIFNGSKMKLDKFRHDGAQDLPNLLAKSLVNSGKSILNGLTGTPPEPLTIDEGSEHYGYKRDEQKIEREKGSPEKYEAYLNELTAASGPNISAYLNYDCLMKVRSIAGEWYDVYKDQLQGYGDEVILMETITPDK